MVHVDNQLNDILPLIEEPVFVLPGPSDLHFPAPLNLLMAEGAERTPVAWQPFGDSARREQCSRGMHLKTSF
jgi:hypothetical protein